MNDDLEYEKWQGFVANPIVDKYNAIVSNDKRIDENDVVLDFAKYVFEIIDIKNLNDKSDVQSLKSMLIDYQNKSFYQLYKENFNLLEFYTKKIKPVFNNYL